MYKRQVDVQSLAGDTSDNVPGVPGIGVKTASELINQYGNLENLLKNISKIKQNKRRETLLQNKDNALLSKKLVTLKKDVPVRDNLENFDLKKIDKEKLYNFLREMEFNRLLSSVISIYGEPSLNGNIKKDKNEKKIKKISRENYKLIESENDIELWLKEADENGEIAIDTETNSLDPHTADLVGISFSTQLGKACYIPLGHKKGNLLNKQAVLEKIKKTLEDKSIKKIGQNIKFDFIVLYHHGIEMNAMEDTMLMSYVLDAGKNRHNMDILSQIHLEHETIKFKEIVGTGKNQLNFSEVDINVAKNYAAEDADITFRLYKFCLLYTSDAADE